MTGVPTHAHDGASAQGWNFRRWRRSRPFWGGLFTLKAGIWIFSTTQLKLGGLSFQMGPTGFLSWLIPTILVAAGLLMWFTPAQRMFYAIVAAVTAVYSLIGVNLGGFFFGMLLGVIGAALGFAWTPARPAGPAGPESHERADDDTIVQDAVVDAPPRATMDELLSGSGRGPVDGDHGTGPMTDVLPAPHNPLLEPSAPEVPAPPHRPEIPGVGQAGPGAGQAGPPPPPAAGGSNRGPRLFAITLIAVSLSAVATVALPLGTPAAYAKDCPLVEAKPPVDEKPPAEEPAPGKPTPKPTEAPAPTAAPTAAPTPTATAAPAEQATTERAAADPVTEFVEGVVDGVKDLLGIEQKKAAAEPAETAKPAAAPTPKAAKGTAVPKPPAKKKKAVKPAVADIDSLNDIKGCTKAELQRAEGQVVRLAAEPGQPAVASPSLMTGTQVTMFGLSYDGVVELPKKDGGTIRALKFSMDRSVTNNFELLTPGPKGTKTSLKSSALTVAGNVEFYTSRFSGKLLGIPLTFTPEHPPPFVLPLMIFGDPNIDLVFVDCDELTAPNLVTSNP